MEIKIVSYNQGSDLETTKYFAILLSKALSIIHLVHWYVPNFQAHEVIGNLYETLDGHFDKLQEEIIGTSMIQNVNFPTFNTGLELDNIEQFKGTTKDIIVSYNKISKITQEILTSLEFNNYISSVKSGINNTKEDIITNFNKTSYLLTMVNC
jgi:DNA-binding ferritin-like protein